MAIYQRGPHGERYRRADGSRVSSPDPTITAKCCCGPPRTGGGGPTICDNCLPCEFDVSFSDIIGADYRSSGGGNLIGSLSGPYRLRRIGPCLYIYVFPDDSIRWQLYDEGGSPTTSYPASFIVLSFENGFLPYLGVVTTPICTSDDLAETPVALSLFGGNTVPTCASPFTIYNAQQGTDDSSPADARFGAIAWGGLATVSRVASCASGNRSVTGFIKKYKTGSMSEQLVAWFDPSALAAGSYLCRYEWGAVNYDNGGRFAINKSSTRKYRIVKQSATLPFGDTSGITNVADAPGSTADYDTQLDCEIAESQVAHAAVSFTADGTSRYGIWLDDASDTDNQVYVPPSNPAGAVHLPSYGGAPSFCICADEGDCAANDQCHPGCWTLRVSAGHGSIALASLPAGDYTLYYSAGAVQYDAPPPGSDPVYRVNDFGDPTDPRGFQIVAVNLPPPCTDPCVEADVVCPGGETTTLANAPGNDTAYGSIDAAESGNAGLLTNFHHPGGELGIQFFGDEGNGFVTFILCIQGVLPPDPPVCRWDKWTAELNEDGTAWTITHVDSNVGRTNPFDGTTENEWVLDEGDLPSCVMFYVTKTCMHGDVGALPQPPDPPPPDSVPEACNPDCPGTCPDCDFSLDLMFTSDGSDCADCGFKYTFNVTDVIFGTEASDTFHTTGCEWTFPHLYKDGSDWKLDNSPYWILEAAVSGGCPPTGAGAWSVFSNSTGGDVTINDVTNGDFCFDEWTQTLSFTRTSACTWTASALSGKLNAVIDCFFDGEQRMWRCTMIMDHSTGGETDACDGTVVFTAPFAGTDECPGNVSTWTFQSSSAPNIGTFALAA